MSDTTLAARIRALAETGTPGPWFATVDPIDPDDAVISTQAHYIGASPDDGVRASYDRRDAAKIVAAVNALPALADLVEAVESRHWLQHGRDCAECGDEWPCPTATALDALAVALGVAQ